MPRPTEISAAPDLVGRTETALQTLRAIKINDESRPQVDWAVMRSAVEELIALAPIANEPQLQGKIWARLGTLCWKAPATQTDLDDVSEFGMYVLDRVAKLLPLIKSELKKNNIEFITSFFDIFSSTLTKTAIDPIRQAYATDDIMAILKINESALLSEVLEESAIATSLFFIYLNRLPDHDHLYKWLKGIFRGANKERSLFLFYFLLDSAAPLPPTMATEAAEAILATHIPQLTTKEFVTLWIAWQKSTDKAGAAQYISRNVESLLTLEKHQPGIYKFLMSKPYNICDFARYPTEVLLDQYEHRNDTDADYGVVVFPYFDSNGAYYEERDNIQSLYDQLAILGNYHLRIYECRNILMVARALLSAFSIYGRINFGIVGGHGNWEEIQLDSTEAINKYQIMAGKGMQRVIQQFFIPNPSIVGMACHAAQRQKPSIMRIISKLGARTTGYEESTKTASVQAWKKGRNIRLNITCDVGPANSYAHGRWIPNNPPKY